MSSALKERLGTILIVTVLAMWAMGGCQELGLSQADSQASEPPAAVHAVLGIDVTGSYLRADAAFETIARAMESEARPGDVWFVRLIGAKSYDEESAVVTLRCPAPYNRAVNPFDARGKAEYQNWVRDFIRLRKEAASEVTTMRAGALPQHMRECTDIYGFLAKAGELLENAPDGATKVVVIASDLVDTERRTGATVVLKNVRVVVLLQGGEDPKRARALRDSWAGELERFGATEVEFLDASEVSGMNLVRRSR